MFTTLYRGRAVVRQQWFLLALVGVLLLGFLFPAPFVRPAGWAWLRNAIVAIVLFLMALPLEISAVWNVFRHPWPALLGSAINMGLVPLLAWLASWALSRELALGLIVASTAPCTLASAAVWTRRAGGNDATAIFVTILTNATCFLVTPFWLAQLARTSTQVDANRMVVELGLLVVLPMLMAQVVRRLSPTVGAAATRAKVRCGTIAQLGILWMVLTGAVKCGEALQRSSWRDSLQPLDFVLMLGAAVSVHLIALFAGRWLATVCRLKPSDRVAVGIAGSQKTLMVGLTIAINYFGGLAILPMIAYHVSQLFLDTLIADRWRAAGVGQDA